MKRVLLVDDDIAVTNYFMVFLMQTEEYESTVVNDSSTVPDLLDRFEFDAILLDMDMPKLNGLEILKIIKDKKISSPVIILTGVSDVDLAVKAMKLGAFDYLTKPVDDEQLLGTLVAAIKHKDVHSKISELPTSLKREDLVHKEAFEHFPTSDPATIRVLHAAEKIAASDLSVFIWGEHGLGKEALARAIHAASPRCTGPFVSVNAASYDVISFAAVLFGQDRDWSGTKQEMPGFIEAATGGTLFLNEIDRLTIPVQTRLLRVIQTNEYYRENSTRIMKADVRFIVSSLKDLTAEEFVNTFSRDLLYHLMVNSLRFPPLRERIQDVPILAKSFLADEMARTGKTGLTFSDDFLAALQKYDFPDNIQELRSIVAAAVVNTEGSVIELQSLSPYILGKILTAEGKREPSFVPRSLAAVQREHIERMLKFFGDDKAKAASELGISEQKIDELLEV